MKKILTGMFCLLVSLSSFGQNAEVQKGINDVIFYGVDFSMAKVYGADESASQFREAFAKINGLFVSEAKKYDIAKFFKKNVKATAVRQLDVLNESITEETVCADSDFNEIGSNGLAEEIKSLPIKETQGTGLVFIAELLNKPHNQATYQIVFFDIASRDILDSWRATGKAKGFGLRNYWAGSIMNILENVKMKKAK